MKKEENKGTSLVAFDRSVRTINTHICSGVNVEWLVRFTDEDKIFIQEVCYTDSDESYKERYDCYDFVDYPPPLTYETKEEAIELVETVLDIMDETGVSAGDAFREYCREKVLREYYIENGFMSETDDFSLLSTLRDDIRVENNSHNKYIQYRK